MRKHSRLPVVLGVILGVFALLLVLSVLVEGPADDATPAETSHTLQSTTLAPAVMPSPETAPEARGVSATYLPIALLACLALALPLLVSGKDANGRVLRRRRYAHSFYLVFRQELACG
jgi:hypothetical protein